MESGAPKGLLVLNAGSSTLKFAVYAAETAGTVRRLDRGILEDTSGVAAPGAVDRVLDRAAAALGATPLRAAGHRVVLGGLEHSRATRIDAARLQHLRDLAPLAPLHQARSLEPIEALMQRHPALTQVACFDTAFHGTVPAVAGRYAIPDELTRAGARRYGFHGLSYEYIAQALRTVDPEAARGRVIVAHLGSGASLCGMVDGRSIATTMGFSPLSGIMMATRPGDLDPAVVLWLQRARGMDVDRVEALLYHECGLAGVSGISGDMRELLATDDPRAREAIDLFVYRIVREAGSLASACGGLDAFVFTGGIGEHAPAVRAAVARGLAWLGLELDRDANERGETRISLPGSRVRAWTLATDEEQVIATHTAELAFASAT